MGIFATSFIQQKQIQGRSTQATNPQMQMVTRIMPPMFAIFSLNFPAGLALYWCTSGLWRIGQQHLIGKRIYTEENKARLEAAKARNEELMATTEPGFMDKVFGGAQPNLGKGAKGNKGAKGEVVDTKEAPAKDAGPAKPSGTPKGGASGRATPPGSRSAASRKRKRKK